MRDSSKQRLANSNRKKIFASKVIAKVADEAIEKVLINVSRKKDVASKWLDKAKFSLLRKASQSSKVLFSKESLQSLQMEHEQLLLSVRAKESTLRSLMSDKVQSNPLSKALDQLVPDVSYTAGTLNEESLAVGDSYKLVKSQVTETIDKTQKKIVALGGVMAAASEELAVYRSKKSSETNSNNSNNSSNSSNSSSGKSGNPDNADPIDDLLNHLSNN